MQVQSINYSHPVLFDSLHISVFVFLFELIRKEKISTATVTLLIIFVIIFFST